MAERTIIQRLQNIVSFLEAAATGIDHSRFAETTILREAMRVLAERTVDGIEADEARCRELLDRSTAVATALSPYIGYAATAEIAKESVRTGRPIRELVLERGLVDRERLDRILSPEAMTKPGVPGQ